MNSIFIFLKNFVAVSRNACKVLSNCVQSLDSTSSARIDVQEHSQQSLQGALSFEGSSSELSDTPLRLLKGLGRRGCQKHVMLIVTLAKISWHLLPVLKFRASKRKLEFPKLISNILSSLLSQ